MRQLRTVRIAVVLATIVLVGCTQPAPPSSVEPSGTAITNVTVIDAAHEVRENHTVVFDGDKIVAVGPSGGELPAAAHTIDGSGKYLIPGLWDMHVHLTYDDAFTDAMPGLFLSYGITSVRDTGGLIDKLEPVISRMRAPDAVAPRVFYSGPLLDGQFVVYDGESRPQIGIRNSTVEMARAHVAELKAAGVDFIKIYELVSPEIFDALVQAGRSQGLPIAAHVPLSMLASEAGPRVDSMEHLRNVELDCAGSGDQLLRERVEILKGYTAGAGADLRTRLHSLQRGPAMDDFDDERCANTVAALAETIQVPTLRLNTLGQYPPFARDDWQELLAQVPEGRQVEWQELAAGWGEGASLRDPKPGEFSLQLVARMHAAGVPIGAGTDTPIGVSLPGYSLHTELERLVEAGLDPLEAIRSATLRPAEFFSLQDEMGSIEVGRKADLVLLEENPLEDIKNTRTIVSVVSKGKLVPEDANE